MKTVLVVLALATIVGGDMGGSSPPTGACLCLSGSGVNIRSTACGNVIGSASTGVCYKYSGSKHTCPVNGRDYDFYRIDYGGQTGWAAGAYLDWSSDARCGGPSSGTCMCLTGTGVNIRDSACGTVIGSASKGQCYKYGGSSNTCSLNGQSYEFYRLDFGGKDGWAAKNYLSASSSESCKGSKTGNEYTCAVTASGKRIHETLYRTPYDCVDYSCRNTCKGGQCVAYVTCNCKRNGKWAPNTSCWRPGRRVKGPDGKCNRNIPANTAIATFTSAGKYYAGHAAVFIRCVNDYSIQVYDQGCGRSIGYSTYGSSHSYWSNFATITNPVCADRNSWPCRVENAGPSSCPVSVKGC